MKNFWMFLLLAIIAVAFSGCAAKTSFRLDDQGIVLHKIRGETTPERGTQLLVRSQKAALEKELLEAVRAALKSGDKDTYEAALERYEEFKSISGQVETVDIYLRNSSTSNIEVTGSFWKGVVLAPKECSESRNIPLGEVIIPYKWSRGRSHGKKELRAVVAASNSRVIFRD